MKIWILSIVASISLLIGALDASAESNPLQELIDGTPKGGELKLEAKTYNGNIVINKPLTIKGKKGTVINGDQTGNVIEVTSDDVTLANLTIKHSGMSRSSEEEYAGVRVMGDHTILKNLTITDSFHGIFLNKTKDVTITGTEITGQTTKNLGDQGNGIHIVRSGENKIVNNSIQGTRDGIYVEYSDNNKINHNTVTQTRYGLHYMYSNYNNFEKNYFNRNTGGAAIMHSDHIVLKNNSFSFNQGSRSFGLIVQTSRDIQVVNNEFHLNQRGLYLEQSTSNLIEGNDFFHNQIGIELWSSATAQTFLKNTFNKNISDVITVGGKSNNEWFKNKEGNYWNKPMVDLNQDQVGDTAFEYTSSLGELIEKNELAYLFLNSPAIKLYEKNNELFSNQKVMALDQYPLLKERNINYSLLFVVGIGLFIILYFYKVRKKQFYNKRF
ncbi:nitrous oxidase accessory protein [Oikeobacillus pervagus]|uniref:Nitrous oxidase accessory protein n=1 Tax=Oikeobacillus pervagus TaxID=1325931 RepID=A0AAJ1WJF4_9BACI|nr:nitrous oxide reductase family maturation protein NosD [Oikeobacillus pervagus]MDQ0215625.1 nitrous oxidase accessory protein [Oikeobacillus pervagus]